MYAISFDLSIASLEEHYRTNSPSGAYKDIQNYLKLKGFARKQGSVYFGNETIDAVKTVMTISATGRKFPWLKDCVSDIRMLRIEENNDLVPALLEGED